MPNFRFSAWAHSVVSTDDIQRALGRIEGRMEAADRERDEIKDMQMDQTDKLDTIVRYIERQKGERRAMYTVGSVLAASCGTLMGFIVSWWTSRHG